MSWKSIADRALRILPTPLFVGIAGLGCLWFMSRWDGIQGARLDELEGRQESTVSETMRIAKQRRLVVAQSEASQREVVRLHVRQRVLEDSVKQRDVVIGVLHERADSLLDQLDSTVAKPIRRLIYYQQAQIESLKYLVDMTRAEADSNATDRDRWKTQAQNDSTLAAHWQGRAVANLKQAKHGCLPVIGCVSGTAKFLVGAAVGAGFVAATR